MAKDLLPLNQNSETPCLTIGWQVTLGQDPKYWLGKHPKAGEQPESELIRIPAHAIANHTAIIAQSGSGKSFFLGRIIEEIMLQTRSRCIILDPNADFRKVREVEKVSLWEEAAYNPLERHGKLPHESTREEFLAKWSKIPIRIRTGSAAQGKGYEQIKIWWPRLYMDFFAEDLDPKLRSELYHCHAFVKAFGNLFEIKYWRGGEEKDFLEEVRRLFQLARILPEQEFRSALEQQFNADQITKDILSKVSHQPFKNFIYLDDEVVIGRSEIERTTKRFIESALTVSEYVSPEVERFYFGKAREYQTAGILQTNAVAKPWARPHSERLEVVDLPSLPDTSTRLLAINSVLTTEWERARRAWSRALESDVNEDTRVPTFIVLDEAHNLIPYEARNKAEAALKEQFRTIVAEGRKYGLFLILVSQRPDKLDPIVLSECENKAVMRLGSMSVLNITRQMLGLDDLPQKMLEKCLEFETSRALLVGPWSPEGPKIIYSASRRTVEGGRNLRTDHWAVVPEEIKATQADKPPGKTRAAKTSKKPSTKKHKYDSKERASASDR